ncbi:amino acid/amide ABC transporter substrate-binding protein, HAAT family (TC 3.A.1.4.-) [Desulfatibacillum alkenivorans DSM 16219]|jgi:branched-chain amino acid transport system substrate-binding protein|uniref:Amino acid/amide ABC transporter substrate-binding protein, HAAT family (TC 3.A.1.4.-) n=1 Tax=Desulfatibacillum alkenivorans DSM 16219 TaxID=1121393 RepID=A0A1M6Q3V3_9BACT|nr:ABC transporter substrate-binding protein [Desulfatibacillum alkenivorans]SHK14860.1 amino acid/amide ABC transporter substrate-binding protein, HAAT family (TC 3.A.1.4.-) [Desulfatibacillum alkenivorans DSM 16219]
MKSCKIIVVLMVGLALSWGLFLSTAAAKPIKIGILGPMSFTQGEGHWNGATMAAEEVNAAGGILVGKEKRKIELVKVDTNEFLSIPDATNAAEMAVRRHKVDFLMGGFRTEAVLVMQDIAMEAKKVFIGCGAAHPQLCTRVLDDYDTYKYWFRLTPINSSYLGKVDFILLGTVGHIIKTQLGVEKVKVAIVAEKAAWADPIVAAAQKVIPEKMGMEVAGVWRPSPVATDCSAELSAIQRAGAHIVFTTFSSSVGLTFAKQMGELKVPAAPVGINVESQKTGFWEATNGAGNYVLTINTYAPVAISDTTIPFVTEYRKRFGETPNYTAGTHDAIKLLQVAIEKAGSIDSDKVVAELEKIDYTGAAGRVVFDKSHDVTWGPQYVTSIGTQWQDGEIQCVWPYNWEGVTYEGSKPYQLPPWVVEYWKK